MQQQKGLGLKRSHFDFISGLLFFTQIQTLCTFLTLYAAQVEAYVSCTKAYGVVNLHFGASFWIGMSLNCVEAHFSNSV